MTARIVRIQPRNCHLCQAPHYAATTANVAPLHLHIELEDAEPLEALETIVELESFPNLRQYLEVVALKRL